MKNINKEDSGIQDITGEKFQIPSISKVSFPGGVPYWPTDKNTNPTELLKLSNEHKKFYSQFKEAFKKDEYFDLEGNVNYLIVLVHELALEYVVLGDEDEFENGINKIETYYSEFKLIREAVYQLVENFEESLNEMEDDAEDESEIDYNQPYTYLSDLAISLEDSLQLNLKELKRVSLINYKQNSFNQFTPIQKLIVRLYLEVYELLEEAYNKNKKNLSQVLDKIEDDLFNKEKYQTAEGGRLIYYNNFWSQQLFTRIFNQCENVLRRHYSYNDFIIPAGIYRYDYTTGEIKSVNEWETLVQGIIQQKTATLDAPLPGYEKVFLQLKPSGWKTKYENIINQYENIPEKFLIAVIELGELINNTSYVQTLYFQAYSYMLEKDTITALTFYLHYYSSVQNKGTKKPKKINKIQKKILFQNRTQSAQFNDLLNELTTKENLDPAIDKLSEIFFSKRKEIILDAASIENIQKSHSQTVELLAELLQDEHEIISDNNKNTKEIKSQTVIVHTNASKDSNDAKGLTDIQKNAIEYIISNNNRIAVKAFETFAREKGQFGNQLIESINEQMYEQLEEILIEEEEGQYVLHIELLQ